MITIIFAGGCQLWRFMPTQKEIYLAKSEKKEPYWPFHFLEKNVIYDFYGSKLRASCLRVINVPEEKHQPLY